MYPRSYQDVVKAFEQIPHVNGDSDRVRRLYNKRCLNQQIFRSSDVDVGDVYTVRLHGSDVIVYYPTHYNISLCGWNTNTTRKTICDFSPLTVSKIDWVTGGFVPRDYSEYWTPPHDLSLVIRSHRETMYVGDSENRMEFQYHDSVKEDSSVAISDNQFVYPIKYKVDRKQMTRLRKKHRFLKYAQAMTKLMPQEVTNELFHKYHNNKLAEFNLALSQCDMPYHPAAKRFTIFDRWWLAVLTKAEKNPWESVIFMELYISACSTSPKVVGNRMLRHPTFKRIKYLFEKEFNKMVMLPYLNNQVLVRA
tara:strand:- start:11954 stop:12874 length:921 start_codon:yes stop_codon:yes gene_type:complete